MLLIGAIIAWITASVAWWLFGPDPLRVRAIGFGLAVLWSALVLVAVSLEPRMFVSANTWRHDSHLRHVRVFLEVGIPWALVPWAVAVFIRFVLGALTRV